MSRKLQALEARRQLLLARCEEQRLELAYRLSQLRPSTQLTAWTRGGAMKRTATNPLAWIAAVAGIAMMLRPKRLLAGVGWITGLVAIASKLTRVLRLVAQLRAAYFGFNGSRRRRTRTARD